MFAYIFTKVLSAREHISVYMCVMYVYKTACGVKIINNELSET